MFAQSISFSPAITIGLSERRWQSTCKPLLSEAQASSWATTRMNDHCDPGIEGFFSLHWLGRE